MSTKKKLFLVKKMNIQYVPYIKYVISPGTRFERDKKVLFDPDGEVAQGKPLINYGWAPSGLKELVEALYRAEKGSLKGFEDFYREKVFRSDGIIVDVLKKENLIGENLPALLRITIKERVEVPALLVNIDRVFFKRCSQCDQSWKVQKPLGTFVDILKSLNLDKVVEVFQCARQLCKFLCENYGECERSYTSTEGLKEVEEQKIECLKELFLIISGKISESRKYNCVPREGIALKLDCRELRVLKKEMPLNLQNFKKVITESAQINCNACIERPLRFDFTPLRYFFFDYKTWSKMQKKRYCKTPGQRNIDALPAKLLSEFIDSYERYLDGTQLIAPINHKGVLEAFLNVSNVRFELKHKVKHECSICERIHQISDIPIKAMFRDSDVFKHEAYFADLLWDKLWEKHPSEFCKSFKGKNNIKISESIVLKREFKVKEISPSSPFALNSYDYAVDCSGLGLDRLVLFDLTTGLWKKSGFHEIGKTGEEYVELWRELLYNIPKKTANAYAVWHIVVNSIEETFFDETAPKATKSMDDLLNTITSGSDEAIITLKSEKDFSSLDLTKHRLIAVPIFNTTQLKGEARWEIKRLESHKYDKLLIWKLVDQLLV